MKELIMVGFTRNEAYLRKYRDCTRAASLSTAQHGSQNHIPVEANNPDSLTSSHPTISLALELDWPRHAPQT